MPVARVAFWKFKPGQRKRGKQLRDQMGDMMRYPGVLAAVWLDSREDLDACLSFVVFESDAAMEAQSNDPGFRAGLGPMAEVAERIPPELHLYDVDFVRIAHGFGKGP